MKFSRNHDDHVKELVAGTVDVEKAWRHRSGIWEVFHQQTCNCNWLSKGGALPWLRR